MSPDHLVTQLQQIARIEEAAAAEQWIADRLWIAVERAGGRKGGEFGIRCWYRPARFSRQFCRSIEKFRRSADLYIGRY
jgi:hypothetical protein